MVTFASRVLFKMTVTFEGFLQTVSLFLWFKFSWSRWRLWKGHEYRVIQFYRHRDNQLDWRFTSVIGLTCVASCPLHLDLVILLYEPNDFPPRTLLFFLINQIASRAILWTNKRNNSTAHTLGVCGAFWTWNRFMRLRSSRNFRNPSMGFSSGDPVAFFFSPPPVFSLRCEKGSRRNRAFQ